MTSPPEVDVTDAALISAVRRGDSDAYATLYERHSKAAAWLAGKFVRQSADRDDVVATGFAEVLQAIRNGHGPQESFRPYLLTSIRRIGIRHSMGRSNEPRSIEADGLPTAAEITAGHGERTVERLLVVDAFRELPEHYQLALWHGVVEDEDIEALAGSLGVGRDAAKMTLWRAKESLRRSYLAQHVAATEPGCGISRTDLAAVVRGSASAAISKSVAEHLLQCPVCQSRMKEMGSVNRAMRASAAPAILGVTWPQYVAGIGVKLRAVAALQMMSMTRALLIAGLAFVLSVGMVLAFVSDARDRPVASTESSATSSSTPLSEPSASASAGEVAGPTTAPTQPVVVGPRLAQGSAPSTEPGAAGAIRLTLNEVEVGATLIVVLPQGARVDEPLLRPQCESTGTQVTCGDLPKDGSIVIPIVIDAGAQQGSQLRGGTGTLRTPGQADVLIPIVVPVADCGCSPTPTTG